MRMQILLILIFFKLLLLPVISQAAEIVNPPDKTGWYSQSGSPFNENIIQSICRQPSSVWFLYKNGMMLYSSDNGKKFEFYDHSDLFISNIFFVNPKNGWAVSEIRGCIYQTSDSGKTWIKQYSNEKFKLKKIVFLNESVGVVSGRSDDNFYEDIILHTADSGRNWEPVNSNKDSYLKNIVAVNGSFLGTSVKFTKQGWEESLAISEDGKTWIKEPITDFNIIRDKEAPELIDVIFSLDGKRIYLAAGNRIYKSLNRGKTWEIIKTENNQDKTWSINFISENIGYCLGENNGIFIDSTADGGSTWYRINKLNSLGTIRDLLAVDKDNIWLSGIGSAILHSADGGNSWKYLFEICPAVFTDIHFFNKNEVWILGSTNIVESQGVILQTKDGGRHWNTLYKCEPGITLNRFAFPDEKRCMAVSDQGYLLTSVDHGKTWGSRKLTSDDSLYDIGFFDSKNGVIIGSGKIYKTTDGGVTWTCCSQEKASGQFRMYFHNNKGIIYGKHHNLLVTDDLGKTWKNLPVKINNWTEGIYFQPEGIYFLNEKTGWMVGEGPADSFEDPYKQVILQTCDYGKTWKLLYEIEGESNVHNVFFINNKTGWIIGSKGMIMKTCDGGKTWKSQKSFTTNSLFEIFLTDEKTGWIVGDFGTILFTETGGE